MSLLKLLLGRRLANEEYVERKISEFEAIPAMGLDALGSSSYGPEAALAVVGAAGVGYIGVVMFPILILLAVCYVSYRQTIRAYANSGGAYSVSKLNLGTNAGLLAAAALDDRLYSQRGRWHLRWSWRADVPQYPCSIPLPWACASSSGS
jgi:hypothetical protein